MFNKAILAGVLGLLCSATHAEVGPFTPLMVIQSIDIGNTVERVEKVWDQQGTLQKGKSRGYQLNILNPVDSSVIGCNVKAKYRTSEKTGELILNELKWKSVECKELMAQSGYEQIAESLKFKIGDDNAKVFFGYKESTIDLKLNKTDFKELVQDLKIRGIDKVHFVLYRDESIGSDSELMNQRAANTKNELSTHGFEGTFTYHQENAMKSQKECVSNIECVIQPWIVDVQFKK